MRSWIKYIVISSIFTTQAWAAAGAGQLSDLIAPSVNVFILFAVLIYATKNKLKNYFDKKSDDIANTVERANIKSKEAQMLLENQQRKMANLASEIKNIHGQSETDIMMYEKNLARETEEKIGKLKLDANSKVNADKRQLMDELNNELLEQVIAKTKNTIKNNKDYQSKVSTKMLQGL
jgi:F0F1-type ATP synthase membrane subunit b/b'